MPRGRQAASGMPGLALVVCCLSAACGDPGPRERERAPAAPVVPEPPAAPARAGVWIEGAEWLSKWYPPLVTLGVTLVNTPASPAWFLIGRQAVPRPMAPGDRETRRVVELYPARLGGDPQLAAKLRAIEICVDDTGCDYAVYLPAGYELTYVEPSPRSTLGTRHPLDIWRLAELRFDDEPAETWTAEELAPDFWADWMLAHPWRIGQVDLEIAQRWDLSFEVPTPP